jgi:hypothetical protein
MNPCPLTGEKWTVPVGGGLYKLQAQQQLEAQAQMGVTER